MAEAGQTEHALEWVESLADQLSDYQPWHATRAALLAKTGNYSQSASAYRHAIATAPGQAEALFLELRLAALPQ
jgi:RNA polymerase sigma-70 factor (ECF subfamily)